MTTNFEAGKAAWKLRLQAGSEELGGRQVLAEQPLKGSGTGRKRSGAGASFLGESKRVLSVVLALSFSLYVGTAAEVQAKSSHHKNSSTVQSNDNGVATDQAATNDDSSSDKLLIAKKDKDSDDSDDDKKAAKDKKDKKDKDKGKDKDKDKKADAKSDKKADAKADKKDDKKDDAKKDAKKDDKKDEKKEAKSDSKDDKKEADADDEKKKGGGFFHLGGKKKDKDDEETAKGNGTALVKPAVVEDPNAPKYKFDPALISVLKDITKTLKESDAVTKLEDPAQKLVAKLVGDTLNKTLAAPDLHANRIVDAKDKDRMEKSGMSTEAWESGPVEVSPELKASVVALWGKRIDGLVTVQVVGNYEGRADGATGKLGEFIAVLTAHSTVDKGFDIQSQQDVNFWIGKIADLKIDCSSGKPADPNLKSYVPDAQYSPITERRREFLMAVQDYKDKLARADEDKKKQTDITATQKVAEALAKTFSEALAKSVGGTGQSSSTASAAKPPDQPEKVAVAVDANAGGNAGEKKSEGSSDLTAAKTQPASEAPGNQAHQGNSSSVKTAQDSTTAGNSSVNNQPAQTQSTAASQQSANSQNRGSSVATLIPDTSRSNRSSWDSPAPPAATHQPSPNATLVYPGRVVAGQYVTVAAVGAQNVAEQFVGISFNGAQLSTGDNGKVTYQVPDDAPPGFSLHVALSGRPEEAAGAIEVLQPLATPSEPQIPNLEGVSPVCSSKGIVTISGHNFDGIAERNRVIVDGAYDATVLVSSPVQLKAQVPPGIPAGAHTLCVSTAGLRSNPGNFDLVTVDLTAAGPDTPRNDLKKLMIKVLGTHNRVRVKLVNQSRDVIKLLKGDEVVVVTSGGSQNEALVPVQRLRWGTYKIDAELLI